MTRDKILEAAALEIERNGLTQFRVKRVAAEANISIALLYSYFEDREDLIAATVVYRFRQVLVGLAEIFTTPLKTVETADDLRAALRVMIEDAQTPFRTEARILRIESMSFAGHNPTASAGIAAAKREASDLIMTHVQPLVEKNLLVPGMSGVAFARIWYALFFGQISLEGEHALSIASDDWLMSLQVIADSMVRSDVPARVP
ncbi:MAG: TetR/AcrR family transcriptional regulator [Acidimicrobiales bacterium]|jgi:AcrR family transcriptional regulator